MKLSSPSLDCLHDVTEPLRTLRPLHWSEILAARRQGRDPYQVVAAFWNKYDRAFAEAERRGDEAAKRLGVAPHSFDEHLIDAAGEVCARVPERVTRWGVAIPKPLERLQRRDHVVSRPTRAGRAAVKHRARTARATAPTRGDPDDDPHLDGLSPRAVELARELQEASDELLASWRRDHLARAKPEQLELGEGS